MSKIIILALCPVLPPIPLNAFPVGGAPRAREELAGAESGCLGRAGACVCVCVCVWGGGGAGVGLGGGGGEWRHLCVFGRGVGWQTNNNNIQHHKVNNEISRELRRVTQ